VAGAAEHVVADVVAKRPRPRGVEADEVALDEAVARRLELDAGGKLSRNDVPLSRGGAADPVAVAGADEDPGEDVSDRERAGRVRSDVVALDDVRGGRFQVDAMADVARDDVPCAGRRPSD